MASVFHLGIHHFDLAARRLLPGEAMRVSWGPSEAFRAGCVVITPHPTTHHGDLIAHGMPVTNVLTVGDVHVTAVPVGVLLAEEEFYVGASIINSGSGAIRYFAVTVGVIRP